MKKKYYWDNYYKKKIAPTKETPFARFVLSKFKKLNFIVYDIGCGNGRDTIFFNQNKISCIGIDKSREAVVKNRKRIKKLTKKFLLGNFCTFFKKKIYKDFIIYSRFTWHTINYKNEIKLIKSIKKQVNLKYLFIEARTINDDMYGKGRKIGKHEYVTSHYRRFIDPKDLKKKLSKFCKILYFKESKNYAKFKNQNPWILRVIAKVN